MKTNIKYTILALCCAGSAHCATLLGFGVEADYFNPKISGNFNYTGDVTINSTLDKQESTMQYGAFFEHPLPLIPNVRVDYTPSIDIMGTSTSEKLSIKQFDTTAYYEILDNIIDLDVGVTAKMVTGSVYDASNNKSFSLTLPMGYLGAALVIPGTNIRVQGMVKYISFSGNSVTDAKIKVAYNVLGGAEIQAGYRYEHVKIDDLADITADVKVQGPFVGVGYNF